MRTLVYRIGVVSLVLWFGGLSCVAGCVAETAAAAATAGPEQAGDGCTDGCCSRDGEPASQKPAQHDDSGVPHKEMDCCQFLTAPANVAAKNAEQQRAAVSAPNPVIAEAASTLPADADASFVSDQSDTHLRCCVLRI